MDSSDLIDISKIEQGQMEVHKEQLNVYEKLSEVVSLYKSRIESLKKDITLELNVDQPLTRLIIETDETRFKQIAGNLIGNAIKYTESGKVSVSYNLQEKAEGQVVKFIVEDTGRGIPDDAHNMIFERFAQADNVEFHEGTGLGLSITKGLLELLGGEIWLKSELNKGSTFYFTLPVIPGSSGKGENAKKDNYNLTIDLTGKKIYIAEDDDFSYTLVQEILVSLNAQVKRAKNGKELLSLIRYELPQLILLDIRMPEMDGFQAVTEIRKLHPDLPVIAQTARAMAEEKRHCLNAGCNDTITKPFKPEDLLKTILPWLEV